ncbi:MAG: response regulator [Bacteroidia bacterium]|nr:response regulator [Bacteroidia bacterium]
MKGKRVLIVDDEADFRLLMKDFFDKKSCTVFLANSLTVGLEMLHQENPDVMMLDNILPDGLGWSKAEFVLANYPRTQLILVSAREVPKTSSSTFSILYKPLIKDELRKMFE